jgi:hypothetical protein
MELKQKPILARAKSSDEVRQLIRQGRKLVFVENDLDVPDGYMLLTVNFKGQKVRAVMPERLLFYMANRGEGDAGDALDEIADFYRDAEENEADSIAKGEASAQKADIVTGARNSYEVYLINKLTSNGTKFSAEEIKRLGLDDSDIERRVKTIAALCLDKQAEELRESKLADILVHKTEADYATEGVVSEDVAYQVRCDMGSHWEYRTKYKTVRRKSVFSQKVATSSIEGRVEQLEKEIEQARIARRQDIGRHDRNLIRQYTNMRYIVQENPAAQLDVSPAYAKQEQSAHQPGCEKKDEK